MPRKTSRYALDTFLRQLARTGNFALAAELAGLAKSGLYKRMARDPGFAEACRAALAAFNSSPSLPWGGGPPTAVEGPNLTARGSIHLSTYAGQPQLRRLPAGCLSEAGVTAFLASLAATCNVRLSAERVGVRPSSIHRRRRRDGRFADAMDQAIAHAAFGLECSLLESVHRALDGEDSAEGDDHPPVDSEGSGTAEGGGDESCASPGRGAGQWGPPMIAGEVGFHDALQLLILHRNAFGTPRTKHDRRQAAHNARYRHQLSDEQVREKLVKGLVAFGKRMMVEEGG